MPLETYKTTYVNDIRVLEGESTSTGFETIMIHKNNIQTFVFTPTGK